jgi:hypothetical protein
MPPRPDGAAVVTADAPAAVDTDVAFVAEVERNDILVTAQKLGLLQVGKAFGVNGALTPEPGLPHDSDVYRIDIPGGADGGPTAADGGPPPARAVLRLTLRPEAAMGPTQLEALDMYGNKLISVVGGRHDPAEVIVIPNLSLAPGPVWVRVRGANASAPGGAYRLIARLSPAEPGAEIEPNNTADRAQPLQMGAEAVGYIGWQGDEDWYRVPTTGLAEGSVVAIDLDGVPGVALRVRVYRSKPPAAPELLADQAGGTGERLALRSLLAPQDGADLLVTVLGTGSNHDDRYRLRVQSQLPAPGSELEPNNDPAHAQAVADGTIQGYLSRGDVDVFRYTPQGAVELDLELTPPDRASATVAVVGEDGKTLARADAKRRAARLTGVPATGPVLIRVSAGRGAANPDEPYRLTIASRLAAPAETSPASPGESTSP